MSALRKIALSVAALFLSITAMSVTTGTASADCPWNSPVPCRTAN